MLEIGILLTSRETQIASHHMQQSNTINLSLLCVSSNTVSIPYSLHHRKEQSKKKSSANGLEKMCYSTLLQA